MSLTLITAPEVSPVTVAEAKAHLRIDGTQDDIYIQSLIDAAAAHMDGANGLLGRCLVTQTWEMTLDEFPSGDCILLPLPPIQSITSITYIDTNGASQTMSSGDYSLSADKDARPRVDLAYNASWPSTRAVRDAVTVRFVSGYGDQPSVPAPLRAAMLLLMGHLNENREASIVGVSVAELPMGFEALISPYQRLLLC